LKVKSRSKAGTKAGFVGHQWDYKEKSGGRGLRIREKDIVGKEMFLLCPSRFNTEE